MDIFNIMKKWFEFVAETQTITPTHTALIFYCLDLNNRLAWKEVFGLPVMETCEFLHISGNTFRKVLNELVAIDCIKMVKKSKNQYTANQISMSVLYQNLLKQPKSIYKAFVTAQQKQLNSNCTIDIHTYNNTLKQLNIITEENTSAISEIKKLKIEIETLKKLKIPNQKPKIKINGIETTELLNHIIQVTGKKFRTIPDKVKKQIEARINESYTIEDIKTAINNCAKDEYHINNTQYLTLEFITRSDKFEKYLNAKPKTENKPKSRMQLDSEQRERLSKKFKKELENGQNSENSETVDTDCEVV